jgi:acyl dehydratase
MSSESRFWEDFEVGRRYPTSVRTITEEDHRQFCRLVGYDVPLFTGGSPSNGGPYGARICPSHLIMSFATAMTGRLFADTLIGLVALERGRFLAPVHPGDTIRTVVEIIDKRTTSNPERGIIVFRDHVLNQDGTTVFQIDKTTLIKRRHA